jgi:enoyl-CoA hydratase
MGEGVQGGTGSGSGAVRTVRREGWLHVSLHRPETRNAVNFEIMAGLEAVLDEAERDMEIRVLSLGGSDGAFISGGDLREFHQLREDHEVEAMGRRMLDLLRRIEALDCWTVALVDGNAYGGGWEVLLAFDIRIGSAAAKIGFTQGRFNLPPGWGGLRRLEARVGRSRALHLLGTQAVVDAEEALRLGLLHEIHAPDRMEEAAGALAGRLSLNGRAFSRHLKRFVGGAGEGAGNAIGEQELASFSAFWTSEEHISRVEAFLKGAKKER